MDHYPWEELAPEGDCPKCGCVDAFKRTPLYLDKDDLLYFACADCGYERTALPKDRKEK